MSKIYFSVTIQGTEISTDYSYHLSEVNVPMRNNKFSLCPVSNNGVKINFC